MDVRINEYAQRLSALIRVPTVSKTDQLDMRVFYQFHGLLRQLFPNLFARCEFREFRGTILLRWPGRGEGQPVLFMNHHDVVEAPGTWSHPPFSGEIAEGKIWGRGTLDTKTGLFAMLQAAEELISAGFIPLRDIWFLSTCNEEQSGFGADTVSEYLLERGERFFLVLDEGGMILSEPIAGAKGVYALVGVGEKGCVDLKFHAYSSGGHASTPGKNTPLVRLGKFMAAAERKNLFPARFSPTVSEMFARISRSMSGPAAFVLGHCRWFRPVLAEVLPLISGTAAAMLRTTLAFTMASGSAGANVLPQEAWVIGNMRYSHHQGGKASIDAVAKLARKFGVVTEVMDPGFDSPVSDYNSDAFQLLEKAVAAVFPGVSTSPYIMTGASDCRYMSRISDNCLRFTPVLVSDKQLDSIHGVDENIDISALVPAVDFYRYLYQEGCV